MLDISAMEQKLDDMQDKFNKVMEAGEVSKTTMDLLGAMCEVINEYEKVLINAFDK